MVKYIYDEFTFIGKAEEKIFIPLMQNKIFRVNQTNNRIVLVRDEGS